MNFFLHFYGEVFGVGLAVWVLLYVFQLIHGTGLTDAIKDALYEAADFLD